MTPTEEIVEWLRTEGPVTFCRYMEEALYGDHGYYTRGGGPGPDFRTAPEHHPAFAETFARIFTENGFDTVLEIGANTGDFARVVLDHYRDRGLDMNYVAVERSPAARRELRENVPEARVEESLDDVEPFRGAVFSNELVDALPVHAVEMRNDGLKEVHVGADRKGIYEQLRDAPDRLTEYFDWLDVTLPDGYRTEVNLAALDWMDRVAELLENGAIFTVDYGDRSDRLYGPRRKRGTVMCFRSGEAFESPYEMPGKCDVTARVNFSALEKRGAEHGLENLALEPQGPFLHETRLEDIVAEKRESLSPEEFTEWFVPVRRLIMPNGMGKTHRVLVQTRKFEPTGSLKTFVEREL